MECIYKCGCWFRESPIVYCRLFLSQSKLTRIYTYIAQNAVAMAIITSQMLLRSLSILHLTLAFYLVISPSIVASQSLVHVLGASMQIPHAGPSFMSGSSTSSISSSNAFSSPNAAAALAGLFLTFLALSDLTAVALPEEIYSYYWSAQAPIRLLFLFLFTAWVWLSRPAQGAAGVTQSLVEGQGWAAELKNSLAFTWGFIETIAMFWVSCVKVASSMDIR